MKYLVALIALLIVCPVFAQDEQPPAESAPRPPMASALDRLLRSRATKGIKPAESASPTESQNKAIATKFKPSGKRDTLGKILEQLSPDAEQRKQLMPLFTEGFKAYETEAKKEGVENDVAAAMAFFIATHWSIYNEGKEPSDAAGMATVRQLQNLLNSPEMRSAKDADKQSLYEWCVMMSTFSLATYHVATEEKDEKLSKTLQDAAGTALKNLLGVEAERVQITDNGLEISAKKED